MKIRELVSEITFNGRFPDVDHMNGSRGIGLESIPDVTFKGDDRKLIKYFTNFNKWKKVADNVNSVEDDGNSEIISSPVGVWYKTEMADTVFKPYAYWDKSNRRGWVHTKANPINVPNELD